MNHTFHLSAPPVVEFALVCGVWCTFAIWSTRHMNRLERTRGRTAVALRLGGIVTGGAAVLLIGGLLAGGNSSLLSGALMAGAASVLFLWRR